MNLTYNMVRILRMRRDLEPEDESCDQQIMQMSPVKIVRELTAWELGDESWADFIADCMVKAGAKPEDF